jgi:hypothetical protein
VNILSTRNQTTQQGKNHTFGLLAIGGPRTSKVYSPKHFHQSDEGKNLFGEKSPPLGQQVLPLSWIKMSQVLSQDCRRLVNLGIHSHRWVGILN